MKTDNNYFIFMGQKYEGNFEQAYDLYQLSTEYPTFSDYLLYEGVTMKTDLKTHMETMEKEFLEAQLKENRYNVTKTAIQLGISRITLNYKLAHLEITFQGRKLNYSPLKK